METILLNIGSKSVHRKILNGKQYIVAPLTLIVPGVLNGSKGPLYYPLEELSNNFQAWNGIPIVVNHPTSNDGLSLSARDPNVWFGGSIGLVFDARVDGKLTANGWFDVEATRRIDPRILSRLERGQPIELSTGLFTENEAVDGVFNGVSYTHIARNYRPDHLAILPDQKGACSLRDGCGVLVNANRRKPLAVKRIKNKSFLTTPDGRVLSRLL